MKKTTPEDRPDPLKPLRRGAPPPPDIDPGVVLANTLTALADDLQRTLTEVKQQAVVDLARDIAAELPGAIDRLVLQRYRRLVLLAVLVLALGTACGVAAGYALRGMGEGLRCADQPDGSRVCLRVDRPARPARG